MGTIVAGATMSFLFLDGLMAYVCSCSGLDLVFSEKVWRKNKRIFCRLGSLRHKLRETRGYDLLRSVKESVMLRVS